MTSPVTAKNMLRASFTSGHKRHLNRKELPCISRIQKLGRIRNEEISLAVASGFSLNRAKPVLVFEIRVE